MFHLMQWGCMLKFGINIFIKPFAIMVNVPIGLKRYSSYRNCNTYQIIVAERIVWVCLMLKNNSFRAQMYERPYRIAHKLSAFELMRRNYTG